MKFGRSSKAKFTFPDEPRIRKFFIDCKKSEGRSLSSINFKKDSYTQIDLAIRKMEIFGWMKSFTVGVTL